mmetsp:Transcript_31226/g.68208  ORF Transcript_31226/g.68208 Transcript_31226/m.68208 type:complete len:298 (-) Transcript_31226:943-1836(-)
MVNLEVAQPFLRGGLEEIVGAGVQLLELVQEVGLATSGDVDFLLNHRKDARRLERKEVHAGLVVVVCDLLHLNPLGAVLLLLNTEALLVEMALQALVAEVDAQLLKAVRLQNLEAEDVQHTNGFVGRIAPFALQAAVDSLPQMVEQSCVKSLGERVSCHIRILWHIRHVDQRAVPIRAEQQRFLQNRLRQVQKLRCNLQLVVIDHRRPILVCGTIIKVLRLKSDVPQVKNRGNGLPELFLFVFRQPEYPHCLHQLVELLDLRHPIDGHHLALVQVVEILRSTQVVLLHDFGISFCIA